MNNGDVCVNKYVMFMGLKNITNIIKHVILRTLLKY